jgi:hypothetical protein
VHPGEARHCSDIPVVESAKKQVDGRSSNGANALEEYENLAVVLMELWNGGWLYESGRES